MVAARRLQQLGIQPVVLEKGTEDGGDCNARISGGMVHIAWNAIDDSYDVLYGRLMAATSGEIAPEIAEAFARNGRRWRGWLIAEGINTRQNSSSTLPWDVLWPPRHSKARGWERSRPRRIAAGVGPDLMMTTLYHRYRSSGGDLRLGACATELRPAPGEQGWIVSYLVGGSKSEIHSLSVLVADGGFQANMELLGRYLGPDAYLCLLRGQTTSTGDGLRMLLPLRAKAIGLGNVYGHMVSAGSLKNDNLWPYPTMDRLCLKGALITRSGDLFEHSATNGVGLVTVLARQHDPRGYAVVFDSSVWETDGRHDPYGTPVPNPALIERGGHLVSAGTVEELGGLLEISSERLARALAKHNECSWRVPITTPPLYAARVVPGITFTMGGPKIDPSCAVLDEDDAPIPGIFAAGSAAGGVHGGPDGGYVGGLAAAGTFGLIAGETIAGFVDSRERTRNSKAHEVDSR